MSSNKGSRSGDFLESFGRYVKKRRGERSLSQQSLGELANLSDRTIREIEMGKGRETLHARTFEKLLQVLDGPDGDQKFQEFCQYLNEQRENGDVRNVNSLSVEKEPALGHEISEAVQPTGNRSRWGLGGALVISALAIFVLSQEFRQKNSWNDPPAVEDVTAPPKLTPKSTGPAAQIRPSTSSAWPLAKLNPEIQATLRDGNLKLLVKLSSLKGAEIPGQLELSRDGVNFERGRHISSFLPGNKLFVQLRRHKIGVIAGPFDLTLQAMEAAQRGLSQMIDCRVGVCTLPAPNLCSRHWSKLSLGRQANRPEFSVDLQTCNSASGKPPVRLCFSAPHNLFPFDDDQSLYGALHSKSGGKFEFPVPIKKANRNFGFDNAPTNARHKLSAISPAASTPPAAIWFVPAPSIQPHHFRIDIGVGSCGPNGVTPMTDFLGLETGFRAIYYDVDGKGYVKGQLRNFGIPLPSRENIEILLEGKDGRAFGPYRYKFERNDVIQKAITASQKPIDLSCNIRLSNRLDPNSWRYHCSAPSRGSALLSWARVKEIHIGSSADSLSRKLKLELDPSSVLERLTDHSRKNLAPIFEIFPPRSQKSVFFLLHYKDGTKSILQRLKLPKRY